MKSIKVALGKRSYNILIGYNIIPVVKRYIERLRLGNDAVIITNPAIYSIYKKTVLKRFASFGFNIAVIKIPDSETSKSNREVIKIIEKIARIDRGRPLFIIALGGGVVGDVAGFVASVYKRGIPYIQIPTTLLAQVDSAIGGKVAIDLAFAKNLVGAFYQPALVVSDIIFLKSLPLRQVRTGLAEIIKYGVIKDRRLFKFLEENIDKILKFDKEALEYIIYRASRIKARIVELDEYDKKGIRAQLNYGHTIGHAIEAASRYSGLHTHGEAVSIGMLAAAEIAMKLKILKKQYVERIRKLLERAGLPTKISKRLKREDIMKAQLYDKKIIRGVNRFVLPITIGKVRICEDIPKGLIVDIIKNMQKGER